MKAILIQAIIDGMKPHLSGEQLQMLEDTIVEKFNDYDVVIHETEEELRTKATTDLVQSFLSAKEDRGLF